MTRHELCELIELHGKDIYSFCCHLTQNRHNADDLYQDTFLSAAQRLAEIDVSGNPKSYLMGLAVGIWRNQTRKTAHRQEIAPTVSISQERTLDLVQDEGASAEDLFLREETCRLVRREIASLDEKYRLPVYLFYAAQMSVEQIADILHLPKGTVKSRLHKARKLIKKKLEDHGYEG